MLSYSQWAFNQLFVGGMCFTRELLEIYLHTLVPIKNTCMHASTHQSKESCTRFAKTSTRTTSKISLCDKLGVNHSSPAVSAAPL